MQGRGRCERASSERTSRERGDSDAGLHVWNTKHVHTKRVFIPCCVQLFTQFCVKLSEFPVNNSRLLLQQYFCNARPQMILANHSCYRRCMAIRPHDRHSAFAVHFIREYRSFEWCCVCKQPRGSISSVVRHEQRFIRHPDVLGVSSVASGGWRRGTSSFY